MLNTLQVISETIFPASQLTCVKTRSSQPVLWLVLANQI